MAIRSETVTMFVCSDGKSFKDRLDAEVYEGVVLLKKVCERHGYSSAHFTRDDLFALLRDHAEDFHGALDVLVKAMVARRTREATGGQDDSPNPMHAIGQGRGD